MTVNIHVMMKILFVCHYRIWLQLFFHANKGKDFMLGFIAHNPYSLNIYDTKIYGIWQMQFAEKIDHKIE